MEGGELRKLIIILFYFNRKINFYILSVLFVFFPLVVRSELLVQFSARSRFLFVRTLLALPVARDFHLTQVFSAPIDFALRVVFLVKSFSPPRFSGSSSHRFSSVRSRSRARWVPSWFWILRSRRAGRVHFSRSSLLRASVSGSQLLFRFPARVRTLCRVLPALFFFLLSSPRMRAGFGSDPLVFVFVWLCARTKSVQPPIVFSLLVFGPLEICFHRVKRTSGFDFLERLRSCSRFVLLSGSRFSCEIFGLLQIPRE
jgi:hypothetical protein